MEENILFISNLLFRYERLNLPREKREEIGRKTKRIIDMGRCDYLKKILHIPNVKMAFYVDPSYTLENVVLIATASAVAEEIKTE